MLGNTVGAILHSRGFQLVCWLRLLLKYNEKDRKQILFAHLVCLGYFLFLQVCVLFSFKFVLFPIVLGIAC